MSSSRPEGQDSEYWGAYARESSGDLYSWSKAYKLGWGNHTHFQYFVNKSGRLDFRVRAHESVNIILSSQPFRRVPYYEFFIGEAENTITSLCKNGIQPNVVQTPTSYILDGNKFCGFWIRWAQGTITFGREGDPNPIISWTDECISILYIGFRILHRADGSFIIKRAPGHVGDGYWINASGGDLPPLAVIGGFQGDQDLYIARANFKGVLMPGLLRKGAQECSVCIQGLVYQVSDYEVLCECYGRWVLADKNNIPKNAIPAGRDVNGVPIYIGRINHSSGIILGKVHHGICYASIDGKTETSRTEFLILVSHTDD